MFGIRRLKRKVKELETKIEILQKDTSNFYQTKQNQDEINDRIFSMLTKSKNI